MVYKINLYQLNLTSILGFILIGFGCAPIYPSIMHSIPVRFGKDKSQSIIGLQMAFAYLGSSFMPMIFGFLTRTLTINLFPLFLLYILLFMILFHSFVVKATNKKNVLKNS